MAHEVTLITGDGTGPELAEAARTCVDATGVKINWDVQEAGVDVMARLGTPLPDGVLDVPIEIDSRRLQYAPRRFGQLGPRPISGDQRHAVRHSEDSNGGVQCTAEWRARSQFSCPAWSLPRPS